MNRAPSKSTLALSALVLAAVTLSSCSVLGTRAAAVTGNLRGFNPETNIRLALVGFNNGQYTADGSRAQIIDKAITDGYTLALPRDVPNGLYRIVVFRDANNNDRFDIGEVVLSKDNGKRLVKAGADNAYVTGTRYGWNIWTAGTDSVQTNILTNYDLEAQ